MRRPRWRWLLRSTGIVTLLGVLFAGGQFYYARHQKLQEDAVREAKAQEIVRSGERFLELAALYTPPLPQGLAAQVKKMGQDLELARDAGGDTRGATVGIALSYALSLNREKAEVEFQALSPTDSWRELGLGLTNFYFEEDAKALKHLDEAIRIDAKSAAAYAVRARVKLRGHHYAEARDDAERAVALSPSFPLAHLVLGYVFAQQDIYGDARSAFEEVIHFSPNFYEAYEGLAAVFIKQNDLAGAVDALRTAVRLSQTVPRIHLAYGAALYKSRRAEEALAELRKARELEPKHYIRDFGYSTIYKWGSDLPDLDVFCGNVLIDVMGTHREVTPDDYQIAFLRALCGTTVRAEFDQFEQALFLACVTPVYAIDKTDVASDRDIVEMQAQMQRFMNFTPPCLKYQGAYQVVMTEEKLRLPHDQIPRHAVPAVAVEKLKKFFGERAAKNK